MRWAVVSDIHGNLPALEAVLADARGRADAWLNLGDIVSGPLWPQETAALLMSLDWPTIAGNHEREVLTRPPERMGDSDRFAAAALLPLQRAWLASLPAEMAPAPGIACTHGAPGDDLQTLLQTVDEAGIRDATDAELLQRLRGQAPALLLCGHTHLPGCRRVGGTVVANPGSVGLPAYDHDWPHPHRVENGSPDARYAIVGADGSVELRAVPYDHETTARRADANGRPDWAFALRSGRAFSRASPPPTA